MSRQDKFVEWLTGLLPEDDPIRPQVFFRVGYLQTLDIDVTEAIVQKIITQQREAWERRQNRTAVRMQPMAGVGYDGEVAIYESVVYYMLTGDRVKIGTTTDIHQRVRAINPDQLLATESGDTGLERYRHKQFASLRIRGEWFRYESPLVEHIEQVRKAGHPGVRPA